MSLIIILFCKINESAVIVFAGVASASRITELSEMPITGAVDKRNKITQHKDKCFTGGCGCK